MNCNKNRYTNKIITNIHKKELDVIMQYELDFFKKIIRKDKPCKHKHFKQYYGVSSHIR